MNQGEKRGMGFVAARCTQCGADIEVDDTKEAGICRHCDTAFVTKRVINNHNTNITKHITKNIHGREKTEAEEFLANGETLLRLKDWEKAREAFVSAAKAKPDDFKTWLGLARVETEEWSCPVDEEYKEHLEKAFAVANEEEKEMIRSLTGRYIKNRERILPLVEQNRPILQRHKTWQTIIYSITCAMFLLSIALMGVGFALIEEGFLWLGLMGVGFFVSPVIGALIDVFLFREVTNKKLEPTNKQIKEIEAEIKKDAEEAKQG
jgi:tetratricopeptide (TPR) repeat protein